MRSNSEQESNRTSFSIPVFFEIVVKAARYVETRGREAGFNFGSIRDDLPDAEKFVYRESPNVRSVFVNRWGIRSVHIHPGLNHRPGPADIDLLKDLHDDTRAPGLNGDFRPFTGAVGLMVSVASTGDLQFYYYDDGSVPDRPASPRQLFFVCESRESRKKRDVC
jgi:hypothetical protein